MKQDQARAAIIQIWDGLGEHSSKSEAIFFWCYLRKNHPELLNFRTPGSDTREAVKSWLISAGRITLMDRKGK